MVLWVAIAADPDVPSLYLSPNPLALTLRDKIDADPRKHQRDKPDKAIQEVDAPALRGEEEQDELDASLQPEGQYARTYTPSKALSKHVNQTVAR